MINELYRLNTALNNAGILPPRWHQDYMQMNTSKCIQVTVSNGEIIELSEVFDEDKKNLRKYGNNQGSYPIMNLNPLYYIDKKENEEEFNLIAAVKSRPELLEKDGNLEKLMQICDEHEDKGNNWANAKFKKHYKNHFSRADKLLEICSDCKPLAQLVEDTKPLDGDSENLRAKLKSKAIELLTKGTQVDIALSVLFRTKGEEDTLVIAFESERCLKGPSLSPTVCADFVAEINSRLLKNSLIDKGAPKCIDAFGEEISPKTGDTMPKTAIPGISGVILRSMNDEVPCQHRYGRAGGDSYLLSKDTQNSLRAALDWISAGENKGKFWIKPDDNTVMYCYPHQLPKSDNDFFKISDEAKFEARANAFLKQFTTLRKPNDDSHAEGITIFILRKMDKARTKVLYTRETNPTELEKLIEEWTVGCRNLPTMPAEINRMITKRTVEINGKEKKTVEIEVDGLDLLEAVDIINRSFKRDGSEISDKGFVPKYHGIELMMEPAMSVDADLAKIAVQEMKIAETFCRAMLPIKHKKLSESELNLLEDKKKKALQNAANMLELSALLLYRKNIKKEDYMENLPYLFGQLLRASDELHLLYCNAVRDGDVPPQFAGGAMVTAAAEAPSRTLAMLGKRIMPYCNWAKSYSNNAKLVKDGDDEKNKKVSEQQGKARYLLWVYSELAEKLADVDITAKRFSDEERIQLFIGYFAELPHKNKAEKEENPITEEEESNE